MISSEHAWLPHSPVVFITTLEHRRGPNGELTSKTVVVNYGGTFNPTSGGVPGPWDWILSLFSGLRLWERHSLAVLKRSGVPVASLRQEQGEKRGPVSRASLLELRQGETVTLELMHDHYENLSLGTTHCLDYCSSLQSTRTCCDENWVSDKGMGGYVGVWRTVRHCQTCCIL